MMDRLINGKQFDQPRRISWPVRMKAENIEALDVYWYVTYDEKYQHIPAFVEGILLQKHFDIYGCLPEWNNEY